MTPRKITILPVALVLAFTVARAQPAPAAAAAPGPDAGTVTAPAPELPLVAFAAIGSSFAQSSRLPELGWDEAQIAAFIDGVRLAFRGKGLPFDEAARRVSAEMGRRVHEIELRQSQQASGAFAQPGRLEQFLKEACKRLSLQQTDSGLCYRIEPGRGGIRPRPVDTVVFSSVAKAADGTTALPQLSGDQIRVKMTALLPGFMEGLQMMTINGKGVFVVPPALLFGDGEWPPGIGRGAPIILQLTLHEVISEDAAP